MPSVDEFATETGTSDSQYGFHQLPAAVDAKELYLDLLKRSLLNLIYGESEVRPHRFSSLVGRLVARVLARNNLKTVRPSPLQMSTRLRGGDWPPTAHTMIGIKRLNNLETCVVSVITEGVPGDLVETGVWRGGASIFMRAVLKAYSEVDRIVWLADSFEGLPPPNPDKYPADSGDNLHSFPELAISLDTVKANFARYGLLDNQVRFLKGWFSVTLPSAPIDSIAVLRLDGDMYESTMDALTSLYRRVSPGGYVIVDDYHNIPACKAAVDDFRRANDITESLCDIDWTGVYWRRASGER